MKIVVIGAGLTGVTAAFELGRRGHQVTVLERQPGPALETSFANGSLITPSMADPWNAPGSWRVLLGSLARSDAPLQLRFHALPSLIGWGSTFLWNSRPAAYRRNTLSNLALALYSAQAMRELRARIGIRYGQTTVGTMKLFRSPAALEQAIAANARLASHGLKFRPLTAAETVAMNPALQPIESRIAGAVHFEGDESGNAQSFTVALAEEARRQGVQFHFGQLVTRIEASDGRVRAVIAGAERFEADAVVAAAGSYTAPLLAPLGVRLPVRPAKGYSISFAAAPRGADLSIPIVDDELHAVVTPLQGGLRVAGTAEFAGYDLTLTPARIDNLVKLLREILPEADVDPAGAKPWCGLRPMSADGVPVIGATRLDGLYLNTGHGHLGWTMAMGSACLLADIVSSEIPAIDPQPYELRRFGGGGS